MEPHAARSCPDSQLPPGYVKRHDALTGYDYYVNLCTGSSQWTLPRTSAYLASPRGPSHHGELPDLCDPDLVSPPHGYRHMPASSSDALQGPRPWPEKHVRICQPSSSDPTLWSPASPSTRVAPQVPPAQLCARRRSSRHVAPSSNRTLRPPQPAAARQPHQPRSRQGANSQQTAGLGKHATRRASSLTGRPRSPSRRASQHSSSHMPASPRPRPAGEHGQARKEHGFIERHSEIAAFLAGGLAIAGLSGYLEADDGAPVSQSRGHSHYYSWPKHHSHYE